MFTSSYLSVFGVTALKSWRNPIPRRYIKRHLSSFCIAKSLASDHQPDFVIHSNIDLAFRILIRIQRCLGTTQHRKETGDEKGSVKGSYGFTDSSGLYRAVDYVADKLGFRAVVNTNEPGPLSRILPTLCG
ncbi:Adult-specific rigid cuticular protein 15.7 like protein [Argiope bruennichi]|uniref:Adult-specific rigid cuticular protein 15.7 like protein n=1 Tax=Argiope bruennichi TaxID=94029 RepID=A0A8T0E6Y5_ARGBR|nr:Adult-specific rigid cuticular protein 15.7 like protein [Argiope bruennichi]